MRPFRSERQGTGSADEGDGVVDHPSDLGQSATAWSENRGKGPQTQVGTLDKRGQGSLTSDAGVSHAVPGGTGAKRLSASWSAEGLGAHHCPDWHVLVDWTDTATVPAAH